MTNYAQLLLIAWLYILPMKLAFSPLNSEYVNCKQDKELRTIIKE